MRLSSRSFFWSSYYTEADLNSSRDGILLRNSWSGYHPSFISVFKLYFYWPNSGSGSWTINVFRPSFVVLPILLWTLCSLSMNLFPVLEVLVGLSWLVSSIIMLSSWVCIFRLGDLVCDFLCFFLFYFLVLSNGLGLMPLILSAYSMTVVISFILRVLDGFIEFYAGKILVNLL